MRVDDGGVRAGPAQLPVRQSEEGRNAQAVPSLVINELGAAQGAPVDLRALLGQQRELRATQQVVLGGVGQPAHPQQIGRHRARMKPGDGDGNAVEHAHLGALAADDVNQRLRNLGDAERLSHPLDHRIKGRVHPVHIAAVQALVGEAVEVSRGGGVVIARQTNAAGLKELVLEQGTDDRALLDVVLVQAGQITPHIAAQHHRVRCRAHTRHLDDIAVLHVGAEVFVPGAGGGVAQVGRNEQALGVGSGARPGAGCAGGVDEHAEIVLAQAQHAR